MGLLDQLTGLADTQKHAALYQAVGNLVTQSGGVGGLAQKFEQQGLGSMIAGWISTGPNPPISGEQVVQVIGKDKVTALAAKAGLSEAQVASGISALLPLVIDHLTPNGTVPNHPPDALDSALTALKTKFLTTA
jgi:uncharacterized protein YidB (DUF937 family)